MSDSFTENSRRQEHINKALTQKIKQLENENRMMRSALEIYSDSEHDYWVKRVEIVNEQKVYHMKNIVETTVLARECLKKLEGK